MVRCRCASVDWSWSGHACRYRHTGVLGGEHSLLDRGEHLQEVLFADTSVRISRRCADIQVQPAFHAATNILRILDIQFQYIRVHLRATPRRGTDSLHGPADSPIEVLKSCRQGCGCIKEVLPGLSILGVD